MLSKRSYEKQINLPNKKIFVCRNLYLDEFDKKIYGKSRELNDSICPLTKSGNSIIGSFIEDNKRLENLRYKNEEEEYKLHHSKKIDNKDKKPFWKYSNHPGTFFEKLKADDVYTYDIVKKDNKWLEGPWLAPRQVGTYFDHDIHPL